MQYDKILLYTITCSLFFLSQENLFLFLFNILGNSHVSETNQHLTELYEIYVIYLFLSISGSLIFISFLSIFDRNTEE